MYRKAVLSDRGCFVALKQQTVEVFQDAET
jgi:hypothetical protein